MKLQHRSVQTTLNTARTPVCETHLEIRCILKMHHFPNHFALIFETWSCRRSLPGCLSSRFIIFFKAALQSLQTHESALSKKLRSTNSIIITYGSPAPSLQILGSIVATTFNCNGNFFQHMTLADDCPKIRVSGITR